MNDFAKTFLAMLFLIPLLVQVDMGVPIPLWAGPPPWLLGGPYRPLSYQGHHSPPLCSKAKDLTRQDQANLKALKDRSLLLAKVHQVLTLPASRRWSTPRPRLLKPSSAARS